MGKIRAFSEHKKWSEKEIEIVIKNYVYGEYDDLLKLLPGRNISQIQNKANFLGLKRNKKPKQTNEERLESKRLHMANKRAMNPEQVRLYQKERRKRNPEKHRETAKAYTTRRFFWTKSMKLKGDNRATYKQLAAVWKSQRGLCALTGVKLDASAQLDHIHPKANGGKDDISNLRWLSAKANLAKRDLTDEEFINLCSSVMRYFTGERINEINKQI